ncbi:MAG: hypothetical protein AAF827_00120 [Cyanobacteria bacterium P01_D01_bin.6]
MSFSAIVFLFGAISLSLGLLGEGVSVKDISIPKINRVSRFSLIIVGSFFMLAGFGLGVEDVELSTSVVNESTEPDDLPQEGLPLPSTEEEHTEASTDSAGQGNPTTTVDSDSPAPTPGDQEFQTQVRQQLIYIAGLVSSEGSSLVDYFVSSLSEGSTQSEWVTLEAGKPYFLIGVCDSDCTDIDLWLHDESGNLIDSDVEVDTDGFPFVTVVPQWTGSFTIKSSLPNCDASYCYYGVGLFQAPQTVTGTGVTY